MDPLEVYVAGEKVSVRGVDIEETHTEGGIAFPSLHVHVQFPEEVETQRVPTIVVKKEGGLAAIHEGLYERGMIPEWYYEGCHSPEEYEESDG